MALSSSGIASGQIIHATHVLQYFNFLTGVMTDQVLTIANTVNGTIFVPTGLTGATSATRFVGGTVSGAPASGTFQLGDFVIDQAGNVQICTAAGTPGTWKSAGVSVPVTVANGGTGLSSLTAHNLLIGNGTGNATLLPPGTTAYPVVSQGASADPAYAQLTGSGIAAGTITGSNIANSTITSSQIASGTITGSNLASGTVTATQLANPTLANGDSLSAITAHSNTGVSSLTPTTTITTTGRKVVALATVGISCSTDTDTSLYIQQDSGGWNIVDRFDLRSGSTANTALKGWWVYTPAAWSHTYSMGWAWTSGATVTTDGGSILAFELA